VAQTQINQQLQTALAQTSSVAQDVASQITQKLGGS
jgi:hypothetical protein